MAKKMALKKVCIDADCAEKLERKSRVWDIPESELIRRAIVALTKGAIPTEHLLTENDRERMWREVMQTMEDGTLAPHTEPGEPIWDRESVYAERLDRLPERHIDAVRPNRPGDGASSVSLFDGWVFA